MLEIYTVYYSSERPETRLADDLVAPIDRVAGLAFIMTLAIVPIITVVVLLAPSSSALLADSTSFPRPIVGVALAPPPIGVLAAPLGRPPPRVRLAARAVAAVALRPPRSVLSTRIVAAAAALVAAPRVLAPRPALVVAAAPRLVLSPAVVAPRPAVIDSTAVFAA